MTFHHTLNLRKAVIALAAGGVATIGLTVGATAASAAPGNALCRPVLAAAKGILPAGEPGYGFVQPPPASSRAFDRVCAPI